MIDGDFDALLTRAYQVDESLLLDFIKTDKKILLQVENFLKDKLDKKTFSDFITEKEKLLDKEIEDCQDCKKMIENIHKKKWREKIKTFVSENGESCLNYAIRHDIPITQELITASNVDFQD